MKYKVLLLLFLLLFTIDVISAKNEEVTLIVTSDGATKDEAVKNALRSAIEQTFGVFVSSNTDILNDELVRDEIATVSSGNIKKYRELSSIQTDKGISVTLEAVISIGKLISYANGKGAECEFDGESAFADMQLAKLYADNEAIVFQNFSTECEYLFTNGFDYKVSIGKPKDDLFPSVLGRGGYGGAAMAGAYKSENIGKEANTYKTESIVVPVTIQFILNETGANTWKRLLSLCDKLGYSPHSFYGIEGKGDYQYGARITNPYYRDWNSGTGEGVSYSFFRSSRTPHIIEGIIRNIPRQKKKVKLLINDGKYISLSDMEKVTIISDEEDYSEYVMNLPNAQKRPFKKNRPCGKMELELKLDKQEFRTLKKLTVVPDNQ